MATTESAEPTDATRIPKYWNLKRHLVGLIGAESPGTALPAERVLALQFGVSRTTVRQALHELVLEGRLERIHGSGTFVARPKVRQSLSLTSYTEDMRAQGIAPSARVLGVDVVPATAELSALLQLKTGARVLRIRRLRLADGEPMAIETTHLDRGRFPRLRAQLERHGSLYTALRTVYGIELIDAEETIESALAAPDEAGLLGVDVGLPMLLLTRHSFDTDGPVEWVRSLYRGDRYRFVSRLQRPGTDR
ncbi:MAG: GntR family transcriptional regulator [Kineosporiaceae bacterium]|nr:GntR family transcriptional regulator [Kineosporiaceae bacterium]MBK7622071.1 GntR family transcriptional regulator [Kineosporiaceae bacterium]MBK8074381.1 GntR family transcriptional regulator [Kineosporiaceae bacterium]